jgi:hypothetical protein
MGVCERLLETVPALCLWELWEVCESELCPSQKQKTLEVKT